MYAEFIQIVFICLTLCAVNIIIVCMTKWKELFTSVGGPKYKALADAIAKGVYSGVLRPGERLPTHRDLADELGVNVSTVTRGYAEAEKQGLVFGTVGRGTYIKRDAGTCVPMVSFESSAPGLLEMGLIEPFYHLDPDLNSCLKKLMRKKDVNSLLQYRDPRGVDEHREIGRGWIKKFGLEVPWESVFVCAGAQHALAVSLAGVFRAGDRIAVDNLTYPGMKALSAQMGMKLTPVAMDEQGMIPGALDTACRANRVKGIYLMPGLHNPVNITMPLRRREELAEVINRHGLIVMEDDAYELTCPSGLPPVSSFAPESSLFVAGISKTMAAGLRVAYLAASKKFHAAIGQAILNTVWMVSPLCAEIAGIWISDGTAEKVLKRKRDAARERNLRAREILRGHEYRGKDTGFYIWLFLPQGTTGVEFQKKGREAGVNLFGIEKFLVGDGDVRPAARISLSRLESIQDMESGLEIITGLL